MMDVWSYKNYESPTHKQPKEYAVKLHSDGERMYLKLIFKYSFCRNVGQLDRILFRSRNKPICRRPMCLMDVIKRGKEAE
jgi:hypothetical protein